MTTSSPTTARHARIAAAAIALGALVFSTAGLDRAHAGSWETGVYTGKIYAKGSPRPDTKVKFKVTNKKIKLLSATFLLECNSDRGDVTAKVAGGTAKLNEGPAGAGFSIYEYSRERGSHQQTYDFVGGVKGDTLKGNAGMSRTYDEPYEACNDKIALYFKATKR